MGRSLYTFEPARDSATWQLTSFNPASPMLLAAWTLSKPALQSLDSIGFKIVVDLVRPHAGVHFFVVVGGGAADSLGTATEEAVATSTGRFASERLEISLAGLFAGGRTMEFVKLFGYFDRTDEDVDDGVEGGYAGFPPASTCYSVLGSGPAPLVVGVDEPCIVQYILDEECQALDSIERVIRQWPHDLNYVDSDEVNINLCAQVKVGGGLEGVFRVRIGGTPGFNDGTLVAEMTTTSAAFENRKVSGIVLNPRALVLVKLTGLVREP